MLDISAWVYILSSQVSQNMCSYLTMSRRKCCPRLLSAPIRSQQDHSSSPSLGVNSMAEWETDVESRRFHVLTTAVPPGPAPTPRAAAHSLESFLMLWSLRNCYKCPSPPPEGHWGKETDLRAWWSKANAIRGPSSLKRNLHTEPPSSWRFIEVWIQSSANSTVLFSLIPQVCFSPSSCFSRHCFKNKECHL